jgi:hypothetical protein
MNDQAIEQEIQAKGKTAPRITPADIDANIASEHYFTAAQGVAGGVNDDMVSRFLGWKRLWHGKQWPVAVQRPIDRRRVARHGWRNIRSGCVIHRSGGAWFSDD